MPGNRTGRAWRARIGLLPVLAITLTAAPAAQAATGYHWVRLASSPLGARSQPDLVWAGRELIELGGLRKHDTTNDGAAYVPATGKWHKIADVDANVGFYQAVTAWTGRQLFVANGVYASCLGGQPVSDCLPRAGLYDPAANTWTTTLLPRAMDNLSLAAAVWTGHDVVLAAVNFRKNKLGIASYDPADHHWRMITPALPARHPVQDVSLVAAGHRLILWSLWSSSKTTGSGGRINYGVDVLARTGEGAWRNVTGKWPQNETVTAPVFTGRTILVSPGQFWCGVACPGPYVPFDGYFANPVTLHRSIIPGGPLRQIDPSFVWTGQRIIAINLEGEISGPGGKGYTIRPDELALYSPSGSRWSRLPVPPHRPGLDTVPVWGAGELLTLTRNGNLLALRS